MKSAFLFCARNVFLYLTEKRGFRVKKRDEVLLHYGGSSRVSRADAVFLSSDYPTRVEPDRKMVQIEGRRITGAEENHRAQIDI